MNERLVSILNEVAPNAQNLQGLDDRLREDLGMDSLQLAVMTVKIEAEFGVDVFADGVVSTVGDVEEKIRRYLAKHC